MRHFFLIILFLAGSESFAKLPKSDWHLVSGKLTYHVVYPLKEVSGESVNVKGKGHCEKGVCQFLVAVPVKSFVSGDGNRDNHMLEVTKGALYPMITVAVRFAEGESMETIDAKADVTFVGKTHSYEHVQIKTSLSGERAITKGRIPLLLSDFAIERPSLLGIKVDNSAPVDFDLIWN